MARKSSRWEPGGAWVWPVWRDRDIAVSMGPSSRDLGPSSHAAPGKGPEQISFPGARGVSSCLLPRSASLLKEVINTTDPNDITKHQTHSYPSSLASAPKIRLLHIPHWHRLVYNLGPRILANIEISLVWQPKEKISLLGCFCLQRPGSIRGGSW